MSRSRKKVGKPNALECPYAEHKYRCKNKKWCVAHPSHCAYSSHDILARNKSLSRAYRRPKIVDKCKKNSSICRVCVDEWFFDIIADVLDERKELKAQKLPKKEYQLKKKELQVKFEELGDEYEDLIAKCTEIDELSTTINSVVPVDTILIEEEPTSFREMLGNALTRGSTRRKQTNVRMPLVYDTYTRDSMEKVVDSPQPKDLMECTQKEQLGACRACVDDWYEDKFEKDFADKSAKDYLRSKSFKKLGDRYQKALRKCI
jgi:hypothetical protein